MREQTGRIVLMDFGTGAKRARTRSGTDVGTPLYMAPEMLAGEPASHAQRRLQRRRPALLPGHRRHPYEGGIDRRDPRRADGGRAQVAPRRCGPICRSVRQGRRARAGGRSRRSSSDAGRRCFRRSTTCRGDVDRRAADRCVGHARSVRAWCCFAVITVGGMSERRGLQRRARPAKLPIRAKRWCRWFASAAQSLFLPIVLTLPRRRPDRRDRGRAPPGADGIGGRVGALDRRVGERRRDSTAARLPLTDPAVCASWLLLVTAACAAAIWAYWAPLLRR